MYFKTYIKNLIVISKKQLWIYILGISKNICLFFSVIYIVSTLTRETYILYVLSYFFKGGHTICQLKQNRQKQLQQKEKEE